MLLATPKPKSELLSRLSYLGKCKHCISAFLTLVYTAKSFRQKFQVVRNEGEHFWQFKRFQVVQVLVQNRYGLVVGFSSLI